MLVNYAKFLLFCFYMVTNSVYAAGEDSAVYPSKEVLMAVENNDIGAEQLSSKAYNLYILNEKGEVYKRALSSSKRLFGLLSETTRVNKELLLGRFTSDRDEKV